MNLKELANTIDQIASGETYSQKALEEVNFLGVFSSEQIDALTRYLSGDQSKSGLERLNLQEVAIRLREMAETKTHQVAFVYKSEYGVESVTYQNVADVGSFVYEPDQKSYPVALDALSRIVGGAGGESVDSITCIQVDGKDKPYIVGYQSETGHYLSPLTSFKLVESGVATPLYYDQPLADPSSLMGLKDEVNAIADLGNNENLGDALMQAVQLSYAKLTADPSNELNRLVNYVVSGMHNDYSQRIKLDQSLA